MPVATGAKKRIDRRDEVAEPSDVSFKCSGYAMDAAVDRGEEGCVEDSTGLSPIGNTATPSKTELLQDSWDNRPVSP